ncbi:MAG: hypothetical protein N3G75_07655 [Methanothrix sp.]|nr:hypothetical protein [Methanothrix sp.]MCX8207689.1 hypothetical protein [Methanothrix sp.]
MRIFETLWGKTKLDSLYTRRAEIRELFLPDEDGKLTKITSTADDLNAISSLLPVRWPPRMICALVQLNGWGTTPISFADDTPARITGMSSAVDMSAVGNGGTIKLTIDTGSVQTATLHCTAGYHTGGSGASTDMTEEVDNKFRISVDGDAAETVTCDWTGCDTGAEIAAEMQSKIRALGGKKSGVTVSFVTDHYVITSPTLGTSSKIRITNAADHDCCDELKIGPDYGTNTDGTGDCADVKAVTPAEIAALINKDISGCTASVVSGVLTITSNTAGRLSRVLAGNGTLNTLCGIPDGKVGYGAIGLGDEDWEDDDYLVVLSHKGASASLGLAWNNPTTSGFDIVPESASSDYVTVIVVGQTS